MKNEMNYFPGIRRGAAALLLAAAVSLCLIGCGDHESLELTELTAGGTDVPQEAGTGESTGGQDGTEEGAEEEPAAIYVFVCGAVVKEGVYELPPGARVYQAVEAAGGYTKEADTAYINQADALTDAQKLEIPTVEEAEKLREQAALAAESRDMQPEEEPSGQQGSAGVIGSLININTADEAILQTLPGIGPAKAASIVRYREANGNFTSIEEIKKVSGIGDITYENLKGCITV